MKILVCCLLALFMISPDMYSQDMPEKILLIKHKEKNRAKYMKEGKRIIYWLNSDTETKLKGRIESLDDSGITIDGTTYQLNDFSKIGGRSTGMKVAQITGGVVLATGTLVTGIGTWWIILGEIKGGCDGAVLVILGVVFVTVGLPSMAIGSIPLFLRGKRFDLENWDLMIVDEVPKKKKDLDVY